MVDKQSENAGSIAGRLRENGEPLAERLDDAVGEASSGIGVLLSELVRRTLRGGVQKIEEEMQEFVDEKVDETVATRMPHFEDVATRSASEKARTIASELVSSVDQQAKEAAERLSQEITGAVSQIDDTSSRLEQQIREASQETNDATQQRLSELTNKSKATVNKIHTTLKQLQNQCKQVSDEVAQERARSSKSDDSIRQEALGLIQRLQSRVEELESEITELKKPRGLRAVFAGMTGWIAGMTGRKKKRQDPKQPEDPSAESNSQES